ncbi:CHAP domain-containing protein [Streptomyces sp. UNOB3_S3]|uniref:CHAP domain-containing protein n=1 Tax=Streptomyces sp. UNOB3_S3 TaxID=2871682 RepID=UPI001E419DC9|nr:CHAP domain-containing protein [Streptomyces sp. UNOB3_S3]
MRTELTRQMETAGAAAGKAFTTAATNGFSALPKSAAAAAKAAKVHTEKAAVDTAAKLEAIEAQLTREYGQQAGRRFRVFRELEERKRQALAGTSQATRRAVQETVRLETQAARDAAQRWQTAERDRIRLLEERRRAEARAVAEREREERAAAATRQRALEDEARMDREIHQTQVRLARESAREQSRILAERQGQEKAATSERKRALEDEARMDREIHQTQTRLAREAAREQAQILAKRQRQEAEAAAVRRRALEDEARMDREIHQAQIRMAREAAKAAEQAEREKREAIRRTMAERQAEQSHAIGSQLAITQAVRQNLREQLAEHERTMAAVQSTQATAWAAMRSGWKRSTQHIEATGTTATETGHLITRGLVAPLGLASTAAAAFGIKSADAMLQAQTGLKGMGVELRDVNSLLEQMTKYGIETPYSVNDMLKYGTRYVRANSSHNADFLSKDPVRHAKGSSDAAQKAVDMVKMVGDSAAYGGVMDPAMVSRGMYAIEVMQDMGRTNLRNVKQLEAATGLPSNTLAQILGFKTRKYTAQEMADMKSRDKKNGMDRKLPETYEASGQMLAFMQNAKETGGISGEQLIDGLLERWRKDPGMNGAAHRMGSATISGRIEQMKEQAQFNLGKLFYSKNDRGEYAYTGLGAAVMGKKVSDEDGTRFEGGLLKDAGEIGTKLLPMAKEMLTEFFDTIGTFTDWGKDTVDFLEAHPGLRKLVLEAAKMAAVAAPFLLAFGVLTKTAGKLGKLLAFAATPAKMLAGTVSGTSRGVRGATRYGRQVAGGVRSRRDGGTFLEGYDAQRDRFRERDQTRRRNRSRVAAAGRENGRFRTAAGYARYGTARLTGYDGPGDWVRRRRNRREDMRDLDQRSRDAISGGRLREGIRLNRRRDDVRQEYRENRRASRRSAAERLRPQDSTDRRDTAQRGMRETEQQLRQVDERIEALKRALRAVDQAPLGSLIDHLGGSVGQSVRSSADQAQTAVRRIVTEGTTHVNGASLAEIHRKLSDLQQKADSLKAAIRQAGQEVTDLDGRRLGSLRVQQLETTEKRADSLKQTISDAAERVERLNGKSLKDVRGQFTLTVPEAGAVEGKIKDVIASVNLLNRKSLKPLRDEFKGGKASLYSAVDAVYGLIGAVKTPGSVNGRIANLNTRTLASVTGQVEKLGDALHDAAKKAGALDDGISKVNRDTDGGGSGGGGGKKGGKKKREFARGGVLPGYAPWQDSIPAILSPGEAVLRPEVVQHLGPARIHTWNQLAVRGRLSRFARGGIAARGGPLGFLLDDLDKIDMGPVVSLFGKTVAFDAKAARIGGRTSRNLITWGSERGGGASGEGAARRFRGTLDFATKNMPKLLRKVPTGAGQLVGLAAGAIAPTAGEYFWDDVWKGSGNILQRGERFASDLLKPESIWAYIKGAWGGLEEAVKAIGSTAVDLFKDPMGALKAPIGQLKQLVMGLVGSVEDSVHGVQEIISNPSEYAKEVLGEWWAQAKEAMPNTEGLLKFRDGGIVPGFAPGHDSVRALLSPGEAVLRPEAVRALGYRTVLGLNSDAKRGRLTEASTDSGPGTPVPDAQAVEDAVKRIEAALASMTDAVRAHQAAATMSWDSVGASVRAAVDGQIRPAEERWISHLTGPLTSAERAFQASSEGVWASVQAQVSTSTSSTLGHFGRLRAGLAGLEDFFESSGGRIREVWRTSMSFVDSSTRSVLSGPYNAGAVPMLAEMAKLAGTSAPLAAVHYSTGGVVPGYQPGIDTVPAMLSEGEGILRPEVVRSLGTETIHRWNDQARRGGHIYARGGIVGDGAAWVKRHQDDPFAGYEEAVRKGWADVIAPAVREVEGGFGLSGHLEATAFRKAEPWLSVWGKWADEHATGGGGQVVKLALQEAKNGDLSGRKYIGSDAYESWCADFVSWIVDHAQATAAYGGSPTGTPGDRWPAVAPWVEHMPMVPTASARPGDLMVYRGFGPGDWGHINVVTGKQSGQLETVGGNESRSLRRQLGYGNRADGALRPRGGAPGAGEGPFLNPWPGSLARFSEGTGEFAGLAGDAVGRWRPLVERVIQELGGRGGISLADVPLVLHRIDVESGGDPNAVNNWDSNAVAGDPSKGLMQVIKSTFDAYAGPYRSLGQYHPAASLYAGLSYAIDRYGSGWRRALSGTSGYWMGTTSASPGLRLVGEQGPELVDFRGGERVHTARQTQELLGGRTYEIHIHEAKSESTTQAVLRAMQYAEVMHGV